MDTFFAQSTDYKLIVIGIIIGTLLCGDAVQLGQQLADEAVAGATGVPRGAAPRRHRVQLVQEHDARGRSSRCLEH